VKVTVLGCGASAGVPTIGGIWGACDPSEPRNRRRRASILVEQGDAAVLVDTTPDLREQALSADLTRLDAVIGTHAHADHLHGIDDLRAFNKLQNAPIPYHADAATLAKVRERFGYVFDPLPAGHHYFKPTLEPREIDGPFEIGGIPVTPFRQDHGVAGETLGLRFGPIAYSTDVVELDDAAFEALDGVETWIVDCFRYEPHQTHAHFDKALDWIARVRPKRAVLTHMNETVDYRGLLARCPPGVEAAYDGMILETAAEEEQ